MMTQMIEKERNNAIQKIVEFIGQNHGPCPSPLCSEYAIHTVPVLNFIHKEFGISKATIGQWATTPKEAKSDNTGYWVTASVGGKPAWGWWQETEPTAEDIEADREQHGSSTTTYTWAKARERAD